MTHPVRWLLEPVLAVFRWWIGLHRDEKVVGDLTWLYLDNQRESDQPVVVILHGFSSVKESLLRVTWPLLEHFRVLMPDLPGHGGTTDTLGSYRAEEQADRLYAFLVNVLGPKAKIHLVGCSMGGMIGGVFATRYPDMIATISLVCPAGITMPTKSPVYQIYEETGVNYMRIEKAEDIDRLQQYTSVEQRQLPGFLINFILHESGRRRQVLEELMRDIWLDLNVLDGCLENFHVPCLVLWGDHDKILDPSCLQVVREKVKSPLTIHVVENAGHIVHQEQHAQLKQYKVNYQERVESSVASRLPLLDYATLWGVKSSVKPLRFDTL
ncbi:hypothetical protein LEN26_015029 [Aphanomyces euteiches]|nr:hypothetical protein LEN26_015029 [Aphanomyces euteiches]